jgi:diaminopimelate decarboxylase
MSLRYQDGRLFLGESGDLQKIMAQNEGHPCYVYELASIEKRFTALQKSLGGLPRLQTHYALKANANPEILKAFKSWGAGVDVVSGGEMLQALKNGFTPEDVIFSGVAKSVEEIDAAIDQAIKQINVESPQELRRIGERARLKNKKMSVAFRMNPEVNPVTHPYITTGMSENKFGMDRSFVPELVRILKEHADHLHLRGVTMHIGSQLLDLSSMDEAIRKLLSIAHELEILGFPSESIDIGGGVGIHYDQMDEAQDFATLAEYGRIVCETLKGYSGEVMIEPGRVLVGRAGVLLCQVEYIKKTSSKNFVIVNTGMHHLMRPALYQANHRILPLVEKQKTEAQVYDVVGPICESSDCLGKNRVLPSIAQGDYLAICDAGAYGFTMANNYNFHPFPKEIVIS